MSNEQNRLDPGELCREIPQSGPAPEVDIAIRQAARESTRQAELNRSDVRQSPSQRFARWFIPAAAVASITLIISVVSLVSSYQQETSVQKLPMHLMLRSKPPAAEALLAEMQQLVAKESSSEAAAVYQRYRHFYPHRRLPAALEQQLIAQKIIQQP